MSMRIASARAGLGAQRTLVSGTDESRRLTALAHSAVPRRSPSQLRFNSTSSSPQPPHPSPSSSQPPRPDFWQPHPRRIGPPSRHSLFYREIWPPFLRCIAYGSGAYFALHLLWTYLDGEEQKVVEEQQRRGLEDQVREARLKMAGAAETVVGVEDGSSSGQAGKSWWKVWSR